MKLVVFILSILMTSSIFGQGYWGDSLQAARDAYGSQEYGKALKYYESAQKLAPKDIDLSDEISKSAYKAREFKKAEEVYQKIVSERSSSPEQADNYHNLGNSQLKQKNYQGAIDSYKESLRLDPSDENTRYNLSEAIRKLKEQQKKQQQNQQKNNQNKNNQNNQNNQSNSNNQGQNNQQGQSGNQQQNSGQQNQSNNRSESGSSQLPNKDVERMLDKLAKKEAETKRKAMGGQTGGSSSKSGKDW